MIRSFSLAFLILATACGGVSSTAAGGVKAHVVAFGQGGELGALNVDVADTDAERAEGLMGVEKLPPDDGMAFVFEQPTDTSFWMKDTLIPLSIAFVDADDTIVTILEMEPCEAEPCPTYTATEPYVLAIEANGGWFEAHAIEVGDVATLQAAANS
ncbi:MAG: DUF192 domain-containing protein [Actinomycetota bacterium]